MKRILFAALLLVAFSTALSARELVGSGPTHSSLGNYKIETADPVTINGEQLKAYTISYENSPMTVTIVVRKDKECKKFIVLSDKLSVQYVCNENYFGVQKLDKSLEKDGYKTADASFDHSEYFHQKKLAPGKREEVENAHLIAAFFPRLMTSPVSMTK
ncbi:MAG TPA: hypothetical protein PLR88_02090 [Bacteroidales bacterium]|nr:hypothetical protein [Bacteroidales bacterium]HPT20709.1 hypothetical protein [Bacteroidales bacterium]